MRRLAACVIAAAALACTAQTTFAQLGGLPLGEDRVDARAEVYGKLLYTKLSANFDGNPMKDVVEFLSQVGGVDILTKWADDLSFGEGLDPEAPITLQLKNQTPLITVLELVLAQATDEETSWTLGEGYITVGTKDMLNKDKYVLIYPVRELLMVVPTFDQAPELDLNSVLQDSAQSGSGGGGGGGSGSNFFQDDNDQDAAPRPSDDELSDELIDLIQSIVDPFQWEENGGEGGSIRYFRGSLIINATDYLHRQVGGYPFSPATVRPATPGLSTAQVTYAPRYVTLSGTFEMTDVVDIQQTSIPIVVGGRVIDSGG